MNNTFTENVMTTMDKHMELMHFINKIKDGEDIDFEHVLTILSEIRKDHINAVYKADSLEKKIVNMKKELELPSIY